MLYQLPRPLEAATVLCRPSASNKSPYLVDVQLDTDSSIHITHNPALGCHGLIVPGARVWVMGVEPTSKGISTKILYLVADTGNGDALVCVNPAVANHVAREILERGYLGDLKDISSEVCPPEHPGTRFDFAAVDESGRRTWIEVKNASLADTFDGLESKRPPPDPAAERKAIFPYGNKRKIDLVSPRALKHCETLTSLAPAASTILLYLSQRTDITGFKISALDPIYNRAVQTAQATGVRIVAYSIRWTTEGKAFFHKPLNVSF